MKTFLTLGAPVLLAAAMMSPAAAQIPTGAQDTAELRRLAEEELGFGITQRQVIEELRTSGLTRSQVQARLQQMGYDASLADAYFDALARGDTTVTRMGEEPDEQLIEALGEIGIELRSPADSLVAVDSLLLDSLYAEAEESRIFGKSLFAGVAAQFEPVLTGPISGDYHLGPGDQLYLILTGDVERTYPLTVTREGFLIIPQVGQVAVSGLTLDELEDRLYSVLGRAYSGVRRGPEATTRFQLSMGRLRLNHVFVVGEVERPSGYQVSPLARAFNALYRAAGPNENGSFRNIVVRRNGVQIAEVDLYPYLLAGDASADVRLEQGDMVFVPVTGPRVTVEGAIRRPGIYEIKPGEGLRDVLAFAGGPLPEAVLRRVQIDRILPPSERSPGMDRAIEDVDVGDLQNEEGAFIPLQAGDIIQLFAVSAERRNRVAVTGGVRRPGQYEWRPGMTLADLVDRANGLEEGAYTGRALVYRLQPDNTRRMLRSALETAAAETLRLADRDSVVVLREDSLRLPLTVEITGYVKNPGEYQLAEGMSLRDLVLAAGGFAEGAFVLAAEVARSVDPTDRGAETADVISVPLATGEAGTNDGTGELRDGVPRWAPASEEFGLRRGDRVYIRRAPGYDTVRTVVVTGEVAMPGEYELGSRQTRISDVIGRAGGLTQEAYAAGFAIVRDGRPIAGDLTAALVDPLAEGNIFLEPDDSLHVPTFDGTVAVTGAVLVEAKVLYRQGRGLRDYIQRAGGFAENADEGRVIVTYRNGERRVIDRFLMFNREPTVDPGSSIYVPALEPAEAQGVNWGQVITRSTGVLTALATLYAILRNN